MKITRRGVEMNTVGELPAVGSQAPALTELRDKEGKIVQEVNFAGKYRVLNIFPSIDTPTCAKTVREFNQRAAQLSNTVVLCISKDLPTAHRKFCAAEGIINVESLSAYHNSCHFGDEFGVRIVDGITTATMAAAGTENAETLEQAFKDLFARALIVEDPDGNVIYSELVTELANQPNYENALATIGTDRKKKISAASAQNSSGTKADATTTITVTAVATKDTKDTKDKKDANDSVGDKTAKDVLALQQKNTANMDYRTVLGDLMLAGWKKYKPAQTQDKHLFIRTVSCLDEDLTADPNFLEKFDKECHDNSTYGLCVSKDLPPAIARLTVGKKLNHVTVASAYQRDNVFAKLFAVDSNDLFVSCLKVIDPTGKPLSAVAAKVTAAPVPAAAVIATATAAPKAPDAAAKSTASNTAVTLTFSSAGQASANSNAAILKCRIEHDKSPSPIEVSGMQVIKVSDDYKVMKYFMDAHYNMEKHGVVHIVMQDNNEDGHVWLNEEGPCVMQERLYLKLVEKYNNTKINDSIVKRAEEIAAKLEAERANIGFGNYQKREVLRWPMDKIPPEYQA